MLSVLFKLFGQFGSMPWLERFVGLGFDSKLLRQLIMIMLRVTETGDIDQAFDRIRSDRELELELQRALLTAETNYWEQCIQDKQNARERDLAIQRLRGQNLRANIMLVMAMIGIVLSVGALVVFKPVLHADGVGMLSAVAAVFGACLKDAYSFEFGSSKISSDDAISRIYDRQPRGGYDRGYDRGYGQDYGRGNDGRNHDSYGNYYGGPGGYYNGYDEHGRRKNDSTHNQNKTTTTTICDHRAQK